MEFVRGVLRLVAPVLFWSPIALPVLLMGPLPISITSIVSQPVPMVSTKTPPHSHAKPAPVLASYAPM